MPSTKNIMSLVVGITISLILIAILLPIGLDQIASVNTTAWDSSVATLITIVVPIIAGIAAALLFTKYLSK